MPVIVDVHGHLGFLDMAKGTMSKAGAYFRWLNVAKHFRKVDHYVWYRLRCWLRRKHQRTRRAFWSTP